MVNSYNYPDGVSLFVCVCVCLFVFSPRQDSLGLWISKPWIPDSLSVELGFWIPVAQSFLGSYHNSKNGVKVQDNPFYGVDLTPNLTPNLESFLLLKKISFNSQSRVKITPKMGIFLLLS